MLTSINQEILLLKEKLREYNKLESLKKIKLEELAKKEDQVKELKKILEKERKDVEKLEGLSMSSIFSTILGNKYERLDKEKEEFLLAKLKYEDLLGKIDKLEDEINHIKGLLVGYGDTNSTYHNLIKEKEDLLIREGGSLGLRLKETIVNIDKIKLDIKEIREAIDAGEGALNALTGVRKKLASAKGWGTWDILGGGLIADLGKHSAIDDANKIAVDVQSRLESFKKELTDVKEFTDIEVNLSSFASFADFFLDGIFADWFVQTKINNSLNNVDKTIAKIEEISSDLNQNLLKSQTNLKKEEAKVKDIVER